MNLNLRSIWAWVVCAYCGQALLEPQQCKCIRHHAFSVFENVRKKDVPFWGGVYGETTNLKMGHGIIKRIKLRIVQLLGLLSSEIDETFFQGVYIEETNLTV